MTIADILIIVKDSNSSCMFSVKGEATAFTGMRVRAVDVENGVALFGWGDSSESVAVCIDEIATVGHVYVSDWQIEQFKE